MIVTDDMVDALATALNAARDDYRKAVFTLAISETAKAVSGILTLADIDEIHHARVRLVALEAAVGELNVIARKPDTVSDM